MRVQSGSKEVYRIQLGSGGVRGPLQRSERIRGSSLGLTELVNVK